ncbi:hypothetical protein C8034_v002692 [Colletotrichum sidae]|uniref:Uncharacterized protein n=1 Tax=Colletotrichum sidae TaxID=1347389 RepID=A0A4V3I2N5_9PEZI|nr:hypothetical protein C8034_v002692 [Colletotrichum sidae]
MKTFIITILAVTASAAVVDNLEARAGCNANNCLRAVRATRFGTATMQLRMAECSSFLAVTETPSPVTVFVTEDIPETTAAPTLLETQLTTAAPSKEIPFYASACGDDREYSSACSCFGAVPATTTLPTSTVTSTLAIVPTVTAPPFVNNTQGVPSNTTRGEIACSSPWVCGEKSIPLCSQAAGETGCVCFVTVEGAQVCAQPNDCNSTCATSGDCGRDEVCVRQSCCMGATCMKTNVCGNEASPKLMFKRRRGGAGAWVKRDGLSRLSLVPHDASLEQH